MSGQSFQAHSRRHRRMSSSSDYGESSDCSMSTAPTDDGARLSILHYKPSGNPYETDNLNISQSEGFASPKVSAETYLSSVSSQDLNQTQQDLPPCSEAKDEYETPAFTALASTPQEFAEYFPSTQKLFVRHDDSALDGNMNLRVDVQARAHNGGDVDLTLFHLRLHNLKRREFSLRRYCRDSGREICHSSRKYSKPSIMKRPNLQRSMSNALSHMRPKSHNSGTNGLKRQDSGYASIQANASDDEAGHPPSATPTNTIQVEFSNYTHFKVRRRGTKASQRYNFEYWGAKYEWKRLAVASGNFKEVSYHLYNLKTTTSLAHIIPIPQSLSEQREEDLKGGWIPPCAMMLEETVMGTSTDLAE